MTKSDLERKDAPSTLEIKSYLHCGLCIEEKPDDVSPRDFAQFEIGYTWWGIQVWCRRHDCNVAHFDLKGKKIELNGSRLPGAKPSEKIRRVK